MYLYTKHIKQHAPDEDSLMETPQTAASDVTANIVLDFSPLQTSEEDILAMHMLPGYNRDEVEERGGGLHAEGITPHKEPQ